MDVDLRAPGDEAHAGVREQLPDPLAGEGRVVLEPLVDPAEAAEDGIPEVLWLQERSVEVDPVGGILLDPDAGLVPDRHLGSVLVPRERVGDLEGLPALAAAQPEHDVGRRRQRPLQQARPVDGVEHRAGRRLLSRRRHPEHRLAVADEGAAVGHHHVLVVQVASTEDVEDAEKPADLLVDPRRFLPRPDVVAVRGNPLLISVAAPGDDPVRSEANHVVGRKSFQQPLDGDFGIHGSRLVDEGVRTGRQGHAHDAHAPSARVVVGLAERQRGEPDHRLEERRDLPFDRLHVPAQGFDQALSVVPELTSDGGKPSPQHGEPHVEAMIGGGVPKPSLVVALPVVRVVTFDAPARSGDVAVHLDGPGEAELEPVDQVLLEGVHDRGEDQLPAGSPVGPFGRGLELAAEVPKEGSTGEGQPPAPAGFIRSAGAGRPGHRRVEAPQRRRIGRKPCGVHLLQGTALGGAEPPRAELEQPVDPQDPFELFGAR